MTITTSKTEKRKADREFMLAAVITMAERLGVAHEEREPLGTEISTLLCAPGGLSVRVDFDGNSCQPDVHVLSWHMDWKSEKRLNNGTFGGNVNPHHKQKATYIASGFEDLMAKLERGLTMAIDGSAYLPDEEPAGA